uniref:Uncharacterized protein n=1 Tax=Pyxicephalus adspersus TaxID=30357 RepID=A0AAV2ZMP4_PYXAD|nr:TPA: hypothetical protein GDO54_004799 [Pyxicephalus adspersus]
MDYERDNVTEGILKLTLKILYLLFDEEYIILKSSGGKLRVTSQSLGLGGCSKSQSSSMEPSPDIITSDIKNSNNILKFTNKIIELLTREVSGFRK